MTKSEYFQKLLEMFETHIEETSEVREKQVEESIMLFIEMNPLSKIAPERPTTFEFLGWKCVPDFDYFHPGTRDYNGTSDWTLYNEEKERGEHFRGSVDEVKEYILDNVDTVIWN